MAAYQSANPNDVSIGNNAVWDDLEKMNDDVSKQASHIVFFVFIMRKRSIVHSNIALYYLRRLNCCRTSCH
jgi:hypothetical protein